MTIQSMILPSMKSIMNNTAASEYCNAPMTIKAITFFRNMANNVNASDESEWLDANAYDTFITKLNETIILPDNDSTLTLFDESFDTVDNEVDELPFNKVYLYDLTIDTNDILFNIIKKIDDDKDKTPIQKAHYNKYKQIGRG